MTYLVDRLPQLRRHVRHLQALAPTIHSGADQFRGNDVLFSLLMVAQRVVDIAGEMSTRAGKPFADYTQAVRNLAGILRLDRATVADLALLPGLRNVVIHEYVELDYERVYAALNRLEPVERLLTAVRPADAVSCGIVSHASRPEQRGGNDSDAVSTAIRLCACRDEDSVHQLITDAALQPRQVPGVVGIRSCREFHFDGDDASVGSNDDEVDLMFATVSSEVAHFCLCGLRVHAQVQGDETLEECAEKRSFARYGGFGLFTAQQLSRG